MFHNWRRRWRNTKEANVKNFIYLFIPEFGFIHVKTSLQLWKHPIDKWINKYINKKMHRNCYRVAWVWWDVNKQTKKHCIFAHVSELNITTRWRSGNIFFIKDYEITIMLGANWKGRKGVCRVMRLIAIP